MAPCPQASKTSYAGLKLHLTLVSVGKLSEPFIQEGCEFFAERVRRYSALDLIVVPEEKIPSRGKKKYIVQQEGQRIRGKIRPGVFTVVVDERGKVLSSEAFARSLETWSSSGLKEVAFILGGPYGLDDSLKEKADFRLSLSSMTLTHGLAKMLLLEQIYRAFTILRGEPYHK
jgi:23S rRNA (pseudouridine1915-N3)-methyltransferase